MSLKLLYNDGSNDWLGPTYITVTRFVTSVFSNKINNHNTAKRVRLIYNIITCICIPAILNLGSPIPKIASKCFV